jgi:hypothetical protein
VDHSCEKCGAVVEDGRPFCPNCRAPQIHVQVAVSALEAGAGDAPGNSLRAASEIPSLGHPLTPQGGLLDRAAATRAAFKAGVIGGLVGIVLGIFGMLASGALAVYFYRRERGLVPGARIGSRLGGAAGVVSFAIDYLLTVVPVFVMHAQQAYTDKLLKFWQALGFNPSDPDIQKSIQVLFTPTGMVLTFVCGMIFAVVLAAASGAVAALLSRPASRP